jgi:hypothetical protein
MGCRTELKALPKLNERLYAPGEREREQPAASPAFPFWHLRPSDLFSRGAVKEGT